MPKLDEYLSPISPEEPCGPNLEYDPEYSVLFAKMINRADVQYGDFVEEAEPINWSEIERECKRLLLRTKDIALLVLLARCRTRLVGATGFYEGIDLLWTFIKTYPEKINPQLMIEGELDIAVRANALAMLIDSEGLLGDLREVVLSKGTGLRLQIRDVERAFAIPKYMDALAPESVISQLQEMLLNNNAEVQAIMKSLPIVKALLDWAADNLKEYSPDFSSLRGLLKLFEHPDLASYANVDQVSEEEISSEDVIEAANEREEEDLAQDTVPIEPIAVRQTNKATQGTHSGFAHDSRVGRKQALESIKTARLWFEQFEPSSPVIVLLKQAEKMVGKRFSDLIQVIPYELLMSWDGVDHEQQDNIDSGES